MDFSILARSWNGYLYKLCKIQIGINTWKLCIRENLNNNWEKKNPDQIISKCILLNERLAIDSILYYEQCRLVEGP